MGLKEMRERRGLSQTELATIAGVSARMISKYETGERQITRAEVGTVIRLATALKVTVEELINEGECNE